MWGKWGVLTAKWTARTRGRREISWAAVWHIALLWMLPLSIRRPWTVVTCRLRTGTQRWATPPRVWHGSWMPKCKCMHANVDKIYIHACVWKDLLWLSSPASKKSQLSTAVLTTPVVLTVKYSVSLKPEALLQQNHHSVGSSQWQHRGLVLSEGTVKRKHAKKTRAKFITSSGTEARWISQGWVDTLWAAAIPSFCSTSVLCLVVFFK